MPHKKNSKFSVALILSIALHLGLIAVLGYSAWQYVTPYSNNSQGESIDAIMVDTSIMSEQYQRQLQHQSISQQVKQQQQQQIEKQAQEIKEKQIAEQQRLKDLEKERLLALEKQKQEADLAALAKQKADEEAKIRAEKERIEKERLDNERKQAELEKQKALAEAEKAKQEALLAKQKADEEAKIRAEKERIEKERLDNERKLAEQEKQKALAEAEKAKQEAEKQKQLAEQEKQQRLKAEQDAKQQALEEAQRQQALDDILGGLTSNVPKSQRGASTTELNEYQSQVHSAITNKFTNPKLYSGKNCILKIQLAPDGLLLNVTAETGDSILCREAISATKLAVFPKPKSNQLYQQVKNLTIDFRPK